jgi:hypothetical protein
MGLAAALTSCRTFEDALSVASRFSRAFFRSKFINILHAAEIKSYIVYFVAVHLFSPIVIRATEVVALMLI